MNLANVVLFFLFQLALIICTTALNVTFDNTLPRRDVNGKLMDIHDGNIVQWIQGGLYYYYGIGYGECQDSSFGCGEFNLGNCGFQSNHSINLYVSPDLHNWTFVRNILPVESRPEAIYYRPKVIYNSRTEQYVLWVNIVGWLPVLHTPNFLDATYLVATSDTPDGVFKVHNANVDTLQYGNGGDFAIFVDDDGSGYMAYDAFDNLHAIQVEKLADDFLSTLGKSAASGILSAINNEAPLFFKRHGFYYLIYGQCCCFCRSGSNARVLVAKSPLGPYTDANLDIDPKGEIAKGQNSFTVRVPMVGREDEYVFVADRWGSAQDGLMGHDMQFWGPIVFDDTMQPPMPRVLEWFDQFTLDINVTRA